MTDTDKLKRLAEAMASKCPRGIHMDAELTNATGVLILALIAENERLRAALVAITEADDGYQRIARRAL